MLFPTRLVLFLGVMLTLVGGAALIGSTSLLDYLRQSEAARRRWEELARWDDVVLERIEAKEEVIEELLAGRLGLLEAAACFAHIADTPPELRDDGDRFFAGATRGERLCRQV